MTDDEIVERLALLERQMAEVRRDVASLLALAAAQTAAQATEPAVSHGLDASPAAADSTTPAAAPSSSPAAPLQRAWRALERGDASRAVDEAFEALGLVRVSRDATSIEEIRAFASVASSRADERQRKRIRRLLHAAEFERKRIEGAGAGPAPWPGPRPAGVPPRAAARTTAAARPPPTEPTLGGRAATWMRAELSGPRGFAFVGGTVMLLGIVFLFVLAANRGWVGPRERVVLGAAVSVGMVCVGVALRVRYGRFQASLATVGAGIAGAYTTLAAATILYSYVPSSGALVAAAGIAAAGGWLGVSWASQLLAGLALVGAAAAPGLVALDEGISWPGPAFALVVLAATIAVASQRRWLRLEATVATVVVAQLAWLALRAPTDEIGAILVAGIGSLVFLAAAIGWQAFGEAGLDGAAAVFALVGGAVALWSPPSLLSGDVDAGLTLLGLALAFAIVALAIRSSWLDLAWTIAAEALLLGGVAAALITSGRTLTVVWGIQAAVLAALAWKLATPRFAGAGLAYLAAGVVHSLVVEILLEWPHGVFDLPGGAAPGLFVLAFASLATGLLLPAARADRPSRGVAAALEPAWDGLVRLRIALRATLGLSAAIMLAGATAAVLSARWLTILWVVLATTLGGAALSFRERRLQALALGFMGLAAVHALAVEVPLETLALGRLRDPIAPVASLAALAAGAAASAALTRFETGGIPWLGPLTGAEARLAVLEREQRRVFAVLAFIAAVAAVWAAGLVAIDVSYEPGQVVATTLWAALGTVVVLLAARGRSVAWQVSGSVIVLLGLAKAAFFDWHELASGAAVSSVLIASSALLLAGFLLRWRNPTGEAPIEVASLAAASVAAAAAITALERELGIDSRGFGFATLAVVAATAAAGVPPYLRRRAGREERWLRPLANGYWALALAVLLFAETELVLRDSSGTIALWGATATALALAWKPLAEDRVWLAAVGLTAVAAVGSLATVTVPSRLVDASEHPASGLWAFALVVLAAWTAALDAPPGPRSWTPLWVLGPAAALTLYGFSLGILELAERVSSGSVETDFQRGHTALSVLWGIGALGLYVVGLVRERRDVRVAGLGLFALSLAKLFLYDLSSLSSITRAFSFLGVGAMLLVAGFFAERLVGSPDGRGRPSAEA